MTVKMQIADISKYVKTQLSELLYICINYSPNFDESTDMTSTTQMCIIALGVTSDFEMFKKFVDLHSMRGLTKA